MDANTSECNEPSVDEGAFWHANMDLYYGYLAGEVVEVEHEPNKYWLASIQYCFKHLVLLRWLGNYGNDFWVDTSMTSMANSLNGTLSEFPISNPRRLFPLGHHLQSQLKSQFKLEKPSRILTKPSLYDPARDPYAGIETINDLLAHEVEERNDDDAFAVNSTSDTASLALAKCKTKINYGQEDQDELEAALQSLNCPTQYDETGGTGKLGHPDQPVDQMGDETTLSRNSDKLNSDENSQVDTEPANDTSEGDVLSDQDIAHVLEELKNTKPNDPMNEVKKSKQKPTNELDRTKDNLLDPLIDLCKSLQDKAINNGRYDGIAPAANGLDFNLDSNSIFFSKPKQFYDVGGANQERLFVPGTLLEVIHIDENKSGLLDLSFWFAFVVRNVGGRLTLRWFLCDEPKFKQGRLEMKSSRSRFVLEDSEQPIDGENSSDGLNNKISNSNIDLNASSSKPSCISSKSITFSMHFCDPKIHTILHAKSIEARYKLPDKISTSILESHGHEILNNITESQMEHVFDTRRMNLDKDRPLINHILSSCRVNAPTYLDLIFAPGDTNCKREVLMSCPKITKLLRAFVKRELSPGVFEIHSEPSAESDEVIKIVYPYESSYAILPLDWANNHEDCLSINPSRNHSPVNPISANELVEKKVKLESEIHENAGQIMKNDELDLQVSHADGISETIVNTNTANSETNETCQLYEVCLKRHRSAYSMKRGFFDVTEARLASLPFNLDVRTQDSSFEYSDPASWYQLLRNGEVLASTFHCCIDYDQKEVVETRFRVMDQLEVVHPSSDSIICTGRIRKVVFPLIWIQISIDCYTVVPFDSTNIYPAKWCETHNYKLISLLPPRKRCANRTSSQQNSDMKRRKKAKVSDDNLSNSEDHKLASNANDFYEKEHFDLGALTERQAGIDYILNEKSAYIKIFFNHKCFTGPSLSKSKICSLPQYVGPGPMRLVIEEVVTKVISVAYVPPRILNDLSSKSFEELLVERNLTSTVAIEFKAKYQKRVHRDTIPVCVNPDDVALYCECICEHIKCCYNLFGLSLYDGDDCPSHCRSLTKSNKFMKRATYYREKARQGEFLNQNNSETNCSSNKKAQNLTDADNNQRSGSTTRSKYTGRGSSESASSSNLSCSDQTNSQTSPSLAAEGTTSICEMKENSISPDDWTIDDVARYLDVCQLSTFKGFMRSEGIDGQALLLLDKATIEEHFQQQLKSGITQEEIIKLCQLVELMKSRM